MKRGTGRSTRKPGMLSSLSSVPPVWPRPRPLTIGTRTPQTAASGASGSEILSPTPPVECLSTLRPGMRERSSTFPDLSIAVSQAGSSRTGSRPRKNTAMRKAASCSSATLPSVAPWTRKASSAGSSRPPSRFLRMRSYARMSGHPAAPPRERQRSLALRRGGTTSPMRILYGVVGEGMGHAIRSRVVLDELVKRHDVQVVVSGRAHDYLARRAGEHLSVKKIWGFTIVTDDNEVRNFCTLLQNFRGAVTG